MVNVFVPEGMQKAGPSVEGVRVPSANSLGGVLCGVCGWPVFGVLVCGGVWMRVVGVVGVECGVWSMECAGGGGGG